MQQNSPMIRFNVKRIENPWLIRQTESHLIFGIFAKHVPLLYVALALGSIFIAWSILTVAVPRGDYFDSASLAFSVGFALYMLAQLSKLQQAIIGWLGTKIALLITGILFLAVLAPMNFHSGAPDMWPDLALALIWIPSIEFIPAITAYQRYVTIGRILFTIPCIYFGIKSGNWYW
jgi:hypothetical protein